MFNDAGGTVENSIFFGELASVMTPLGLDYVKVANCKITTTDTPPISSSADTNIIINNPITKIIFLSIIFN